MEEDIRLIDDRMRDHRLYLADDLFNDYIDPENMRQVEKWGIQNRRPEEWMLYLMEEMGELAEAIAEHKYRDGSIDDVIQEATHTSTLALKILEMYVVLKRLE